MTEVCSPAADITTHRAIIESLDNSTQLIAAGPKEFCERALVAWVGEHSLDKYDKCFIMRIESVVVSR